MSQKEELKGINYPRHLIPDKLEESSKIYGDDFKKLWDSLTPHSKDINWGKVLVFGTSDNKLKEDKAKYDEIMKLKQQEGE